MMQKTITTNQLIPGNSFFVRGKVSFSKISRQTTDEERAKINLNKRNKIDKNYTTMSIYDAKIIAKDQQNLTPEEQYGLENFYKSSNDKFTGLSYTAINKSTSLPRVKIIEKNGDPDNNPFYKEIKLKKELQKGTDVTLIIRVFAGNGNNGVSLDTILINDPNFKYMKKHRHHN